MSMARKRVIGFASILGVVGLLVGACGGGQPAATPVPVAPTATARPQATATTAAPAPSATAPAAATATARPQATSAPATPTAAPTARPSPTPAAASIPSFPQAKYGGTLLRRTAEPPPGWDAHQNRTQYILDILQPVYDQLVQMDPYNQSEVIPALAQSWKSGDNGLTWTFVLNKGIKFHDGTPLTAQDVKYTYENVILNPPQGVITNFKNQVPTLGAVTAPDDYTVVMKLKSPDASFLSSIGFGYMAIFSKAQVEAGGRQRTNNWPPIGTGPFKAKDYVRGVSTEIVRNDGYWNSGRPFLNSMKFFVIPDPGTAFAALLSAQINFGLTVTPQQNDELKARLGNKIFIQSVSSLTWNDIKINALVKPFDDVRVRQAIAYAVDKGGLAKLMNQKYTIGGYLAPGTGWELPESELKTYPGFDTDMNANIAKAKKLLADAGFPDGFRTPFYTRNSPNFVNPTTAIMGMLKVVGITGEMQLADTATYDSVRRSGSTQWAIAAGGTRTNGPDPNSVFGDFILPDGPRSVSGLKDPKVTALYDAQNSETDPVKRKQKAWELERYALILQAPIPVYYQIVDYAWYANIKNYGYHVAYAGNGQFRDVWME